jgi:hypothetical protein
MSTRGFGRRSIERWLACLLMCGLIVNLHLIPGYRAALADDPLPEVPPCLVLPISPEMQQLIDLQEAVWSAVFAGSFDVCEDGLLLDEPLDDPNLPAFASGQNSDGEPFSLEVLDWFPADFSELPPEDQALLDDWGAIAGVAIGELSTGLGAIRVVGIAASVEPPDQSVPRMNVLLPVDTFGDDAWEALYDYWYAERIYWNPCGGDLDEEAEACLANCLAGFRAQVDNCWSTREGCLFPACTLVCTGAVVLCLIAGGPSGYAACVVGAGACAACVAGCNNEYHGCLEGAAIARDTCAQGCCISLAYRQAEEEPAP